MNATICIHQDLFGNCFMHVRPSEGASDKVHQIPISPKKFMELESLGFPALVEKV